MRQQSSRQITRRQFSRAGLTLLGGAALAACTSSPAPAKPAPAPAAGASPGASGYVPDRTVKVGIAVPQSGPLALAGTSSIHGIKLALKEYEDKGWRFDVILEDDKAEPTTGVRVVEKLMERDQVNFLIGPISSGVLPVLRDPVDQAKVIMSTPQAATRDITGSRCSRYIFRTTPTNYMQAIGFGPWIARNLGKRAYILTSDFTAGIEIADAIQEGFTREGGEIIAYAKAPLGTADFAPYMGPILDARPDVVTGFFAAKDAIDAVKAFHQFGVKDRMKIAYSGYLTTNDIIEAEGQAETEGIYGYLNFSESLTTPGYQEWAQRLKALFPEITRVAIYPIHGYTATKAVLMGIEQARSLKSDDVANAMEKVQFEGPAGPISFGPSHQAALTFYVTQIRGMQHTVLDTVPNQKDPNETECRRTW